MASLPDPVESFLKDSLRFFPRFNGSLSKKKKGEVFSLDSYLANALDGLVQNLVMLDQDGRRIRIKGRKREDFSGFSSNLRFARIGGALGENGGERKISSSDGVESLNGCRAELVELVPRLSDEKNQFSVKEFKQYVETKGKQLFEELDRDKDGQVSLEDLEVAMSKRRLPKRNKWREFGSAVPISQPAMPLAQSVLKSALAGGIACSFSAFVMHPVDTIKTVVQASTLSLPELISKLSELGLRGLYKGSIPTVLGQFSSHGLRTGLCEASKFVLRNVNPALPDIQVESLASFISAILGTASRVPCEVLKQRLQAGIFDNVGEAAIVTWRQDGMKGFFRGTGATLCREVPFYVLGMGLYEETKKGVQKLFRRELEPWETVLVGAVTGGLASVLTTPFDVIKTRMMTAPQGVEVTMQMAAITILREEGPLALFRGALPRFFWVAPLGAINFAGYELLRKAMDRT